MIGVTKRGRLYRAVCSDENITEAWHRVRTQGSDTPGVDGVSLGQFHRYAFQELRALQRELERGTYSPLPVKVTSIHKQNGGRRSIGILSVRDRVVQVAVLNVLEPLFEPKFADASFAYRPGRSTAMALDRVARLVNSGFHWIARFDIEDCFETIDCVRLERMLRRTVRDRWVRRLIRGWLAQSRVRWGNGRSGRSGGGRGLVQGSPLSPFLSNVYLDCFDKQMLKRGFQFVRYADDVILLGRSPREVRKALRRARRVLRRLGLTVNRGKTWCGHVEDGVVFLGETLTFQVDESGEGRWEPSGLSSSPHADPVGTEGAAWEVGRPQVDGSEDGAGWGLST